MYRGHIQVTQLPFSLLTAAVNVMGHADFTFSGICVIVPVDSTGVLSLYLNMMGNICANNQLFFPYAFTYHLNTIAS